MSEKKTLTRAELVRQRRQEQSRRQFTLQRLQRKKTPETGYRELPPITTRGAINDFGVQHHKKTHKRRFHLVLGVPRLQERSLSVPRLRIRSDWRLLSLSLCLLLGAVLYLLWNMPQFRVTAAQVTGDQRIPADEINTALGLSGYPIFLLSPDQIEARALRAYPELASVDVNVSLPNLVTVNVVERQPVILWQQGDGYTWVDENGVAFRPRGEAPGLIVVQELTEHQTLPAFTDDSLTPKLFITPKWVQAIQMLATAVPAGTPIVYDPVTGLSWNDERGWQVVFGASTDNIAMKVRVYQSMVDWLTQRGMRPALINIMYPNAPFYRLDYGQVKE